MMETAQRLIAPASLEARLQSVTFPVTVRDVVTVLENDDVDFEVLETALGKDPSLVMRILAVANSSFYGFSGEINSLHHACMVLGLHTTRHIVMSVGIMELFHAEKGRHLDLEGLWRHSVAVGAAARVLAGAAEIDPDKAFTAGLLHDIGKMVLDVYFTEEYAPVRACQKVADCPLHEAEREVLGLDHAKVGGMLAQIWRLPRPIIDAIAGHHNVDHLDCPSSVAMIHLADYLAHRLSNVSCDETGGVMLQPEALLWLGLERKDLDRLLPCIEEAAAAAIGAFET